MKRALKVLVVVSVVIALLSAVAFAGIIKSDNAAKWAMTSGQGKKSFSFIVFGDNRGTSPGRPLPEVLNVILREIGYIHPDFAINTGDIEVGYTDTLPKARAELMEFINRVKKYAGDVNMLFVPGNHEAPNAEIAQLYRKFFGKKLYYDFMYGNSHFVMLDTTFPRKWLKNGQKYGFYNVNDGMHKLAMVDWTQRVLKTKAEHTFVAQHVPLFSALTPNFGKHPKSFTSRGNRDRELSMLLRHKVDAVFAGHEHLFYARVIGNTKFFTIGGGGAPLYGPTTGGYGINTGKGPMYKGVTSRPEFDHGGRAAGYHYNLHFPAGALSIFSYMLVNVNDNKVSYELLVPHSIEVNYTAGNNGISAMSKAVVANRTAYARTLRGIKFLMPYSKKGYEVKGTVITWGGKVKAAKKQPKIVEIKKLDNYKAIVRVEVVVPAAFSVEVSVNKL